MAEVGVNAWGWEPWGLPMAAGMALHSMDDPGYRWSKGPGRSGPFGEMGQLEAEEAFPDNSFIQNARQADLLADLHRLARAMPCHDRPEEYVRLSGAYGRPDGGQVEPHALHAMESRE